MAIDDGFDQKDRLALALRCVLYTLLAGVALLYLPSLTDHNTPKSVLFLILTSVLAAGFLTLMVLQGEVYLIDTPVYYTILAFLAINFVSLFQSYNIYQGLQTLLGLPVPVRSDGCDLPPCDKTEAHCRRTHGPGCHG